MSSKNKRSKSISRTKSKRISKLQLLANDIETTPLKRSNDLSDECGDVIRSIRDCNKTQTIRLMEHCLDQMNNKKLNKVKKELINYFDLRNINGQQFGRMDSKQFSNSIINHLGDEHKSLLNILRKLWVKMITFEFDKIDSPNSKKLYFRKQSVFNNQNIQNVNNQISEFDSEQMAQLLKNDILTNNKNEKLLQYKEEIIEYFVEYNVSGKVFNAMKAKEFVTNLRKHLKIQSAKMKPALRALHESIKNYQSIQSEDNNDQNVPNKLPEVINRNSSYIIDIAKDNDADLKYSRGTTEYSKDNKEINTSNTLLDDLSPVSDEETASQPLLIPHITHRESTMMLEIKEEEVESIQNIESISECTNEQIVYILNEHIFDIINNEKLNPYKDKIVAFFKDNEIDGKKFIKLKRPQLGKDLVAATGAPNKMKSILMKVHKALKGCKPNELGPAKVETEQKEEEEKEPNMCDVRNIDDCDVNQFVYVLRNYALCDKKLGELQEYSEQIIDYFVINQIDGNKFNETKRKDFAAKVLEHTKAKKTMKGKLLKLYGALSKWKNPNYVLKQQKTPSVPPPFDRQQPSGKIEIDIGTMEEIKTQNTDNSDVSGLAMVDYGSNHRVIFCDVLKEKLRTKCDEIDELKESKDAIVSTLSDCLQTNNLTTIDHIRQDLENADGKINQKLAQVFDVKCADMIVPILLNDIFVLDQRKRRRGTSNLLISRKSSTRIRSKPKQNQTLKPKPLDFNLVYEQQKLRSERVDEKANRKIQELANVLTAEDLKEEEKAFRFDNRSRMTINPLKPNISADTNRTADESKKGEDDFDNQYPVYLNVAIFGKSEDEALEKLIDRAVLDVCYHPEFAKLWDSKKFIDCVYSDVLFPNALNKVFETINDAVYNEYGFIGAFINTHFKREIDQYLRKLNKKGERERTLRPNSSPNVARGIDDEKYLDDHERTQWVVSKAIVNRDTQCANFDISPKQNQNDFLMEFSAEDAFDANYSWAVFKKKRRPPGFGKDGVMEKTKGYWKVLEDDDYDSDTMRRGKSVHSKAEMFDWIKQVQKPIFGLKKSFNNFGFLSDRKSFSADEGNGTTIYSAASEMKNTQNKKSKFQLIPLWHLNILFEFMLHQKASNKCHYKKKEDTISIGKHKYILVYWNGMERTKCNSFIIKIGNDDREYYYMRYCHQIDKLRWDWYDNDNSKYKRFLSGGVEDAITKELEACYHANLEVNFPRTEVKDAENALNPKEKFQHCHLLQLKKFVNPNSEQQYVLRFTINDRTPFRITNMEQCACSKNKQPFPRNVRRLINGRNTIDFDGQKTNDYIEEWKKRYLLQTLQQQKYFFSFVLSVSAVIKYIEIELSYQMISSPSNKDDGEDDELFSSLDDQHVRQHRMDFEVSEGFFIPPKLGIEIDIDKDDQIKKARTILNMNELRLYDSENVIVRQFKKLADDDEYFQHLLQNNHKAACNHVIGDGVFWELHSVVPDDDAVYCNDCAKLILFSEYIKKYVLESENNEACEQLWPWYRNYFRREDHGEERYYFKNISKHNLSNLYDSKKCLWNESIEEPEPEQSPEEQKSGCCKQTLKKMNTSRHGGMLVSMITDDGFGESGDAQEMKKAHSKRQIRHFREFAAHVMLNGWDIIRNMNILRMQLAWIEKYIEVEKKGYPSGNYWGVWKEYMDECNVYLTLHDPDCSSIRPENDFDDEKKVDLYKKITVSLFDAITKDPKCNLYNPQNDTIDDKKRILSKMSEGEKMKLEQKMEYFTKFKSVWQAVPVWWNEHSMKYEAEARSVKASVSYYNYDHLLLQLALVYNLDIDKYAESLKNDPMDKLGFTQFLEWIKDWRNVQHRLRYLTFIICKYLKQCERNIEDLKLDSKYQISQYKSRSIIFLNGYMHHVHRKNCELKSESTSPTKSKRSDQNLFSDQSIIGDLQTVPMKRQSTVSTPTRRTSFMSTSQQILDENPKKDPFLKRNLEIELKQTFRSFDICRYGKYFAESILRMAKDNPTPELWRALQILVTMLPYEITQSILNEYRHQLTHRSHEILRQIGESMLKSSCSTVQICLFLAQYMQENADQDMARHHEWTKLAEKYEKEATKFIDKIESDLLLSIYLTVPILSVGEKTESLLKVALDQRSTNFLNNQRITTVLKHLWHSASALNPNATISLKPRTAYETFTHLVDQPFQFYLTPIGFDAISKTSHLLYVVGIYFLIAQRVYLSDPISRYEWFIWALNFGYILYEVIECYMKGFGDYLGVSGWVNMWDIAISIIWLILFLIRISAVYIIGRENFEYDVIIDGEEHEIENIEINSWRIANTYMVFWAIQAASLSLRSLALFQTSHYFGVLLTIIIKLCGEMAKFLFVLLLLQVGYTFGWYYLSGGYMETNGMSVYDWYTNWKFLFELTLGMQEIPDGDIAEQMFLLTYIVFGTILLMNLLIALMTRTFEEVDQDAKKESAFARAEAT